MPNRTISLDDVSDAIRKQLVGKGINFSHWVRMKLRTVDTEQNESELKVKRDEEEEEPINEAA